MKILLYNPDNGVTRNFMPHLWMFLLQALTPPGHEVVLIDGNAQPMDEEGIARYVREQNIGLVGIGAMTRMIAKAYRMADAVRAAQCASGIFAAAPEARGRWMGYVSDYPGGVRARLSIRMRVLHGDRIFWRLHPLSHE